MRRFFYVLVGYAVLNFILFIATTGGHPKQRTAEAAPSVIRGFSGHWMIFYCAALSFFTPGFTRRTCTVCASVRQATRLHRRLVFALSAATTFPMKPETIWSSERKESKSDLPT